MKLFTTSFLRALIRFFCCTMDNLLKLVEKFSRTHLLVVGDLMLDRFIRGEVERMSPEAPVPVVRVLSESTSLGGAANVVHNVRSLGGRVTACGIVGQDDGGKRVIAALRQVGASIAGVCVDRRCRRFKKPASSPARATNKLSVWIVKAASRPARRRERSCASLFAPDWAATMASSFPITAKGSVHKELLDVVGARAAQRKIICVIDPKKENYQHYRFPTLVTPNKDEASEAAGITIDDAAIIGRRGYRLVRQWRAQAVSDHPRCRWHESVSASATRSSICPPSRAMSSKSPAREIRSWPCAPWRLAAAVVTKRQRCWPISRRDLSAMKSARWPCRTKNSRGYCR